MDARSRHGISTDGITDEPHKTDKAPCRAKRENHQPNKKMCGSAHGVRSGLTWKAEPPATNDMNKTKSSRTTKRAAAGWLRRLVRHGGFKFEVRQLGRGCPPDISVTTQAPSSCGVRVCIETEMSFPL